MAKSRESKGIRVQCVSVDSLSPIARRVEGGLLQLLVVLESEWVGWLFVMKLL